MQSFYWKQLLQELNNIKTKAPAYNRLLVKATGIDLWYIIVFFFCSIINLLPVNLKLL